MTTLIVKVDDDRAESLKRILQEIPYVHDIETENVVVQFREPSTQYERVKKILDDAKGKNLFQDINDASEWQREIRKEWDRDSLYERDFLFIKLYTITREIIFTPSIYFGNN